MKLTKNYWFKAKKYGWGWTPSSWQGWTILAVYIVILFYRTNAVRQMTGTDTSFMVRYYAEIILITIPLLIICYLTGEKPRWRWGD